ncbi:alkene reductase [Thalassorhabdomicrobium marinisediminis]|uniref:alkene reductase n=1 Tax=Thalassorhabdomicrobium marinisediminis TaxID=2170577 RepID=UPI00249217D9|nr:alkene reductase [Thalassorhabdomicrobium marinisediminis]
MQDIKELFDPVRLGAFNMHNRIVMSPMTRSRAGKGDCPTALHAEYYGQRADAGLIVTEGVQPSAAGKGYCRTPGLYSPEQIDGWGRVAEAVHDRGGKIVVQLMHCGRIAARINKDDESDIVAPSAITANWKIFTDTSGLVDMDAPRALETDEVAQVVDEYRQAAVNARAAGLDGVELHASSGYLPMQFLSTNTNKRSDQYGGNVKNRVRFSIEVLTAMGEAIGFDRVGLRTSPGLGFNDIDDADPAETYGELFDQASTLGLAYLHLVRNKTPKIDNYALTRERWKGALILNGNLTAPKAASILQSGGADAVSFGRDFIGNPDLVERLRRGVELSDYDQDRVYTEGPEGFTDYPVAT